MITIIPKKNFKTVPWKNGKGQTTELAISEEGTLDNFDWRLSIATVAEDGIFSNFSGIARNLVLIEGNGITLTHDVIHTDRLVELLDFATFDGGSKTYAEILNGTIKDFNIMTNKDNCAAEVSTFKTQKSTQISHQGLVFAYSISGDITVSQNGGEAATMLQGDLLQLRDPDNLTLCGQAMLLVKLTMK